MRMRLSEDGMCVCVCVHVRAIVWNRDRRAPELVINFTIHVYRKGANIRHFGTFECIITWEFHSKPKFLYKLVQKMLMILLADAASSRMPICEFYGRFP